MEGMLQMKKNFFNKSSIILVLCFGVLSHFLAGCSKITDNNIEQSNNYSKNSETISQIYVAPHSKVVVALSNKGNLYLVQDNDDITQEEYGEGIKSLIKEPLVIAKDVKKFFDDGTIYVDFDDNLYIVGLDYLHGGLFDEYTKIGSNIKTASTGGVGLYAVSNVGELYAYGARDYYNYDYDIDEKIALVDTPTKDIVDVSGYLLGTCMYLTKSGELFAKGIKEDQFKKIADNILKLEGKEFVHGKDGKVYKIKWMTQTLEEYEAKESDDYPIDVKTMLFERYKDAENYYVYLNNNNKIVLYSTNESIEKKELDNKISSMSDILEFISLSFS